MLLLIPRTRVGQKLRFFHSLFKQPQRTSTPRVSAMKPEYYEGPLDGTAPEHRCYILLHAKDRPSKFPKAIHTQLSRELLARGARLGGITVNFAWMEHLVASGKQSATVYSHLGGRLDIPHISLNNIDEVERQIFQHVDGPLTEQTSKNVDIYVCTHAARDCRCGERGQQVYDAFIRAIQLERRKNLSGFSDNIRIGAVGHVGGHKYAANVLIYPHGEWLGCVKPEDASWIIEKLIADTKKRVRPLGAAEKPFSMAHWRGRMGMTVQQMKTLYHKFATQGP